MSCKCKCPEYSFSHHLLISYIRGALWAGICSLSLRTISKKGGDFSLFTFHNRCSHCSICLRSFVLICYFDRCVTQLAILPCQCRGVQLHFDLLDNKAVHLLDKIVHQRKVRLQPDCLELDVGERDVPGDARWAFHCLPSHPFSQLFSLEQMEHLKIHTRVFLWAKEKNIARSTKTAIQKQLPVNLSQDVHRRGQKKLAFVPTMEGGSVLTQSQEINKA